MNSISSTSIQKNFVSMRPKLQIGYSIDGKKVKLCI